MVFAESICTLTFFFKLCEKECSLFVELVEVPRKQTKISGNLSICGYGATRYYYDKVELFVTWQTTTDIDKGDAKKKRK